MNRHYIAITTAPEPYWEGWWERVATVTRHGRDCVMLRSRRTGADARVDAEVLIGRAHSGCHYCDAREQADD